MAQPCEVLRAVAFSPRAEIFSPRGVLPHDSIDGLREL